MRPARQQAARAQDKIGIGRWLNEGGHLASEAEIERETAVDDPGRGRPERGRKRVLIAGGGVAGLETLLALRALAPDRVEITILAPELKFINRSMSVSQPFNPQRVRGLRLEDTAHELGVRWHRGTLDRFEHERHRAVTRDGDELPYDMLVLALGAHPERE
nr:FAD-dependent oxidoreductase [Actinomycetota bacterium]